MAQCPDGPVVDGGHVDDGWLASSEALADDRVAGGVPGFLATLIAAGALTAGLRRTFQEGRAALVTGASQFYRWNAMMSRSQVVARPSCADEAARVLPPVPILAAAGRGPLGPCSGTRDKRLIQHERLLAVPYVPVVLDRAGVELAGVDQDGGDAVPGREGELRPPGQHLRTASCQGSCHRIPLRRWHRS